MSYIFTAILILFFFFVSDRTISRTLCFPAAKMMMFFYVLLIIVTLMVSGFASYVHYFTRFSRSGRLINKIPGPYSVPVLGCFYLFKDKSPRKIIFSLLFIYTLLYAIYTHSIWCFRWYVVDCEASVGYLLPSLQGVGFSRAFHECSSTRRFGGKNHASVCVCNGVVKNVDS